MVGAGYRSVMTDRRTVIAAAGLGLLAAGTGVGVAGCSSPSAGSGGSTTGTGAGASGTTVAAADVPVGSGVVVGAFIVTQPIAGTFQAYSNVCPHQSCAVDQIKQSQVVCPCHESVFSLADGSRVSGPTPRGLTPAKATLSGTTVTVSAT